MEIKVLIQVLDEILPPPKPVQKSKLKRNRQTKTLCENFSPYLQTINNLKLPERKNFICKPKAKLDNFSRFWSMVYPGDNIEELICTETSAEQIVKQILSEELQDLLSTKICTTTSSGVSSTEKMIHEILSQTILKIFSNLSEAEENLNDKYCEKHKKLYADRKKLIEDLLKLDCCSSSIHYNNEIRRQILNDAAIEKEKYLENKNMKN